MFAFVKILLISAHCVCIRRDNINFADPPARASDKDRLYADAEVFTTDRHAEPRYSILVTVCPAQKSPPWVEE